MWISKELDITVQNVEKSHKDSQNRLINSDENWYKLEWKTNLVNQTLYKRKTWLSKSLKVASWIKKSGKKKDPTLVMGKKLTQILIKICFTTNMCRQLTQHYSKLAPIYMPPPPQKNWTKMIFHNNLSAANYRVCSYLPFSVHYQLTVQSVLKNKEIEKKRKEKES